MIVFLCWNESYCFSEFLCDHVVWKVEKFSNLLEKFIPIILPSHTHNISTKGTMAAQKNYEALSVVDKKSCVSLHLSCDIM